ncbi:MAG: hypothetical protein ACN6I4_01145 [bacterium]
MNFFKWFFGEKEADSLFYHEDDFCQIEFQPQENIKFVESEIARLNDNYEENFDGFGFKEAVVREEAPIPLVSKTIESDELDVLILGYGLSKEIQVYTGYGQSYREISKNTYGYGKGYAAIYFDFNEEAIVKHIWMTNVNSIQVEGGIESLIEKICNKWQLLCIDWESFEIISFTE